MKKSWLALAVTALMGVAPLAALTCHCVSGDCSGVGKPSSAQEPQCHHAAKPAGAQQDSRKGCCGKCQLERAELSFKKLASSIIRRAAKTLPAASDTEVASGFSDRLSSCSMASHGPPFGFLTGHVLNVTFSFRGPPVG